MTGRPDATAVERSVTAATGLGDRFDMTAVQALWQEHRRWIAAVLLAYKPHSAEVDDLLQEVAMTLVAKINTVREDGNIRAWLRAVAVNAARAAGRTERSRPMLRLAGSELDGMLNHSTKRSGDLDDHAHRVLHLAAQLPETYREPLLLKAVQGMRSRQISEILGISEATVDTRVSRARRMLREQAQLAIEGGSNSTDDQTVSRNGHSLHSTVQKNSP